MDIIVFIIAGLCAQVSSQYGCFPNENETLQIFIPERIPYGETLFTTLTNNKVTIGVDPLLIIPFFVELHTVSLGGELYNISLVSNTSVTEIDENETLCEMSRVWGLKLICWNDQNLAVFVHFTVKYTDDADPVLKMGLSFPIQELAPVNTTVGNLNNIDKFYTDKDCAQITTPIFNLQEGNTDEAFRLSGGVISVNRLISFQKGEMEFELTVLVTTSHDFDFYSQRNASTKVVINIIDIDDNDPVFNNPVYTIHVQEENSTVLNVPHLTFPPVFAFDQDTGINDSVTYSINGSSNTIGIGNETGLVWVTRVLDREATPFVNLTIKANQVHNSWRSSVATILVAVDDINDNRPKFQPDNPAFVTIPEHCAAGLSVVRVLALDDDTGENALFNYTLDPPESSFTVQTDNLDKQRYGIVIVTNSSALDRETISSLNITVGTVEYTPAQGGDCGTGMCNITITIQLTDINDNSPVFENPSYSLTVTDNTIGAFVEMINASDADEGENANLRYKCVSSDLLGADACDVMSVNSTTGELRLIDLLDILQMYYALIEACDIPTDFSQRRCTTVPVTVALDLELNVTSYNFTVHENLPPKTYVGNILIYNSHFMLQHDNFELKEGTLRTTKPLDRETDDQFMIDINTNNQNNTNISVLVTVLDVNDNSPVFINSSYVLTVMDNSLEAYIDTISATDADEGENAELKYKCVSFDAPDSDGCSVITVDNTTGDVRLQPPLVSSQMYFALVEACDSPADNSQSRCTTVPVIISLHPDLQLNVTSYNFSVYENLPDGTYVGDILNFDDRYNLQHDNFELNERTLRTTKSLDREMHDQFMFVINTNNQNITNISVLVTVLDVNDNSPVFINSSYVLTVMDNSMDAFIDTISASDADDGDNADLRYKCVSFDARDSDGCGVITVGNTTGEVRLQQSLVGSQIYFALVEVCDSPADVSQSRCTTVPVIISLHPDLQLNVTSYNFSVYENLPEGTYVGGILNFDDRYSLQHDNFELIERTLRTKQSLDREMHDHFMFVINTNNQNNTNISVLVTVLDVNDNSPVFINSSYVLTVMDNSMDAFIDTISANDVDEGENADLIYKCMSFAEPDSDGCSVITVSNTTGDVRLQPPLLSSQIYFALVEACDSPSDVSQSRCTTVPVIISLHPDLQLNVTSYNFSVYENLPEGTHVGEILSYNDHYTFQDKEFELNERTLRTTILLDREEQNEYILVINTNNKNNTNISVLVTVLDVNDNSPVFNNTNYRLTVMDNREDAFVETIQASDADEGENAVLRYSCVSSVISNGACDVITINDTTGEIRLHQPLVSSQTYYALVEACDSPTDISHRRCTIVPVGIHLPSAFNATSYNFMVHENLPAGTYVGYILNHNDHFVLQHDKFELNEGTLRTKEPLDREKQDRHMLVINTNSQNNTNISVLVIVLDVNDNYPFFSPHNGSVTLSGEEMTGHVITAVNASDDDEGANAEITYSLEPDSMLQYFHINASGAVILQTLSTLETMDLLVKASDGGLPSLSGFYTLRITIPAVNGSVVIFAPMTSDIVAGERKRIEGELMLILAVNVTIEAVRQHSADSSAIYITARGTSTGHPLKIEELQQLVDSKPAEIAALFRQSVPDGTNEETTAPDDFTTPVIVLIVIAAVLLIALIIATVLIARAHRSRKRHTSLHRRLSTSSTVNNSISKDGNKQDEINEAINPDFVDEDSQSVTLINETEATSVVDTQSCHNADNGDGVPENDATERPPDADSGVPSDRENGQGDDDIHNSSDDGSSSPQTPRNSGYLAAVLDEPLLNSADPVDVTSSTTCSDAQEASPLPDDAFESGPPAEPPGDFEVQDNYLTFAEEEVPKEVTEAALPIDQAEVESNLDPETTDDDIEETRSLDGFLGFRVPTRSFTPPMVRKSQEQREEELEPMPEEPMPDYGKRVRFNFQVTEHEITDYNDNDRNLDDFDDEDPADDEEEFPSPLPTSSTDNLISEFSDDLRESDEHDPNTNEEEEITSF